MATNVAQRPVELDPPRNKSPSQSQETPVSEPAMPTPLTLDELDLLHQNPEKSSPSSAPQSQAQPSQTIENESEDSSESNEQDVSDIEYYQSLVKQQEQQIAALTNMLQRGSQIAEGPSFVLPKKSIETGTIDNNQPPLVSQPPRQSNRSLLEIPGFSTTLDDFNVEYALPIPLTARDSQRSDENQSQAPSVNSVEILSNKSLFDFQGYDYEYRADSSFRTRQPSWSIKTPKSSSKFDSTRSPSLLKVDESTIKSLVSSETTSPYSESVTHLPSVNTMRSLQSVSSLHDISKGSPGASRSARPPGHTAFSIGTNASSKYSVKSGNSIVRTLSDNEDPFANPPPQYANTSTDRVISTSEYDVVTPVPSFDVVSEVPSFQEKPKMAASEALEAVETEEIAVPSAPDISLAEQQPPQAQTQTESKPPEQSQQFSVENQVDNIFQLVASRNKYVAGQSFTLKDRSHSLANFKENLRVTPYSRSQRAKMFFSSTTRRLWAERSLQHSLVDYNLGFLVMPIPTTNSNLKETTGFFKKLSPESQSIFKKLNICRKKAAQGLQDSFRLVSTSNATRGPAGTIKSQYKKLGLDHSSTIGGLEFIPPPSEVSWSKKNRVFGKISSDEVNQKDTVLQSWKAIDDSISNYLPYLVAQMLVFGRQELSSVINNLNSGSKSGSHISTNSTQSTKRSSQDSSSNGVLSTASYPSTNGSPSQSSSTSSSQEESVSSSSHSSQSVDSEVFEYVWSSLLSSFPLKTTTKDLDLDKSKFIPKTDNFTLKAETAQISSSTPSTTPSSSVVSRKKIISHSKASIVKKQLEEESLDTNHNNNSPPEDRTLSRFNTFRIGSNKYDNNVVMKRYEIATHNWFRPILSLPIKRALKIGTKPRNKYSHFSVRIEAGYMLFSWALILRNRSACMVQGCQSQQAFLQQGREAVCILRRAAGIFLFVCRNISEPWVEKCPVPFPIDLSPILLEAFSWICLAEASQITLLIAQQTGADFTFLSSVAMDITLKYKHAIRLLLPLIEAPRLAHVLSSSAPTSDAPIVLPSVKRKHLPPRVAEKVTVGQVLACLYRWGDACCKSENLNCPADLELTDIDLTSVPFLHSDPGPSLQPIVRSHHSIYFRLYHIWDSIYQNADRAGLANSLRHKFDVKDSNFRTPSKSLIHLVQYAFLNSRLYHAKSLQYCAHHYGKSKLGKAFLKRAYYQLERKSSVLIWRKDKPPLLAQQLDIEAEIASIKSVASTWKVKLSDTRDKQVLEFPWPSMPLYTPYPFSPPEPAFRELSTVGRCNVF